MTNPTLYVILNNELNMSPGKAAAQAVHAAMMLKPKQRTDFMSDYRRTVIVLGAKNQNQLTSIGDYLFDAKIEFQYYVDEGVNEVDAFSTTALAVEPIDSEDPKRNIFAGLPVYGAIEYKDEEESCCDDNYTESEQSVVNRTVYDTRRQVGVLTVKLDNLSTQLLAPKPKWYDRFKRKQNEFVS